MRSNGGGTGSLPKWWGTRGMGSAAIQNKLHDYINAHHNAPVNNSYGFHNPNAPAYVPGNKNNNRSSWGMLNKQAFDSLGGGVDSGLLARNRAQASILGLTDSGATTGPSGQILLGQRPGQINNNASGPQAPSAGELMRFNQRQVTSEYRPALSELTNQIANANAMGIQSQNAIGGWGQNAGQEIASAGRRNNKEVAGIQNNLGGMLGAIGGAAGNMGTAANNRGFFQGAANSAGLISGLGAADQGWFNRARDVNAQTTNFYRNNARDQYAQQAFELQQQRNDKVAEMRAAQANAATQAKQTAFDNALALQDPKTSGVQSEQDRAALRADARANFLSLMQSGIYTLGESLKQATGKLTNPEDIAAVTRDAHVYYGGKGTPGASRRMAVRKKFAAQNAKSSSGS